MMNEAVSVTEVPSDTTSVVCPESMLKVPLWTVHRVESNSTTVTSTAISRVSDRFVEQVTTVSLVSTQSTCQTPQSPSLVPDSDTERCEMNGTQFASVAMPLKVPVPLALPEAMETGTR
jgi:hypothetical protein